MTLLLLSFGGFEISIGLGLIDKYIASIRQEGAKQLKFNIMILTILLGIITMLITIFVPGYIGIKIIQELNIIYDISKGRKYHNNILFDILCDIDDNSKIVGYLISWVIGFVVLFLISMICFLVVVFGQGTRSTFNI